MPYEPYISTGFEANQSLAHYPLQEKYSFEGALTGSPCSNVLISLSNCLDTLATLLSLA